MSVLLSVVFLVGANAYEDVFAGANAAYASNDFATAIRMYEQLVGESVVDPVVFFNLGDAYYRNGRLGPAIANYERALQLQPNFQSAWENLTTAIRDTKHRLSRPQPPDWQRSLLFWHYEVSRRTTNILAAVFWCGLWVVLGMRQWRPLRYTRRAAIIVAVFALAFGISAWDKAHPVAIAVANDDVVPVHYGTNENETVRFELYEGDRVTVDKRTSGWARVTTADGERGWAKDNSLVFVGPPYDAPPPKPAAPAAEAPSS